VISLFRRMGAARGWLAAIAVLALGAGTAAANTAAPATAAAPAVGTGSVLQVVAGLAAVLALVGGAAWLLKRFSGFAGTGSGLIRVIGGAAVGQRERVVLVEVDGTWLLLGVAPGQVRALHTMPRSESAVIPDAPPPAEPNFATWLRRMTERRKHG
jgi:flagellar protein FliO/FliZ